MPTYTTDVTFTTANGRTRTLEHNAPARSEYDATQRAARYVKANWSGSTIAYIRSHERRKIKTANFTIQLDRPDRGYFEHDRRGDEHAGGLWFNGNDLIDFDGVHELPKEVRDALIADGFTSTEGCLD